MLSPVWMEVWTRRPAVFSYQLGLKELGYYDKRIDGIYGKGSATAVKNFQDNFNSRPDGIIGPETSTELLTQATAQGWEPGLKKRIMEVIAFYEIAGSHNAFGRASKIADGAGANYGVMQANRHGSCLRILKLGGNKKLADKYYKSDKMTIDEEIAKWFGSPYGIQAQCKYFDKVIWSIAKRIVMDLPGVDSWDTRGIPFQRLMLLAVDTVVQNGGLYSPSNKPFWRNSEGTDSPKLRELFTGERWDRFLGSWVPYAELKSHWDNAGGKTAGRGDERKAVNRNVIHDLWNRAPDNIARLVMLAQYRARCSWSKYWTAVERRRMTDATGEGMVNGRTLHLARDFNVGIDAPSMPDREPTPEDFHKEAGADILQSLKLS